MKTKSFVVIILFLGAALLVIACVRWTVHSYVIALSNPHIDILLGTWRITWDKETEHEVTALVELDRVKLRLFGAYVSDDATVTFKDDEGCHHLGTIAKDGDSASGSYWLCEDYPDWTGTWEAVRVSD